MTRKILKNSRVFLALVFFIATAFLFLDFMNLIPTRFFHRILFLQFVPSLIKFLTFFSIASIGFFIVMIITVLVGRVYCSTICPLGVFQDIFIRISNKFKKKKGKHIRYKKPLNILRYTVLAIVTLSFVLGTSLLINFLDPYSNFGRIFSDFGQPFLITLNNFTADFLAKHNNYTLSVLDIKGTNYFSLAIASAIPIIVIVLSITKGRLYCNTICPVGSFLGLLSKFSIFKIVIDKQKCTVCTNCLSVCKSNCIDLKSKEVDFTRCVDCYNCLKVCPESAINYHNSLKKKELPVEKEVSTDTNRRDFIVKTLAYGATLTFAGKVIAATNSQEKKKLPISPAGSKSLVHFNSKCTACHACVSACPTKVLKPSFLEYGFLGLMQPHLDCNISFCNFECTICSQVCPNGAIMPLTKEQKITTQIGQVEFIKENCVVFQDETACGACSEHCPTKAVQMIPYKNGIMIPKTDVSICVGCGACQYACPMDPKAMIVNGNSVHKQALKPKEEKLKKVNPKDEEFPF